MLVSFRFLFLQLIDYWLSFVQKVNGKIQGTCDLASKWMYAILSTLEQTWGSFK